MTSNTREIRSWQFWALAVASVGALVTSTANLVIGQANQQLEQRVNEQQRVINDGLRLGRLHAHLVQSLANAAVQTDDAAIRDLLSSHGITYTVNRPAPKGGSTNGK